MKKWSGFLGKPHLGHSDFWTLPLINRGPCFQDRVQYVQIDTKISIPLKSLPCSTIQGSKLSGILYTDITDHLPIFLIEGSVETLPKDDIIKKRSYSEKNIENFKLKLGNIDWSNIMNATEPQEAYSNFHQTYAELY